MLCELLHFGLGQISSTLESLFHLGQIGFGNDPIGPHPLRRRQETMVTNITRLGAGLPLLNIVR